MKYCSYRGSEKEGVINSAGRHLHKPHKNWGEVGVGGYWNSALGDENSGR